MLALVFDGKVRLAKDWSRAERKPGEARLAMRVAGVCDTDLQISKGYMGFRGVLGHEVVAQVIESDDSAWHGKRVAVDINAGCGVCVDCTLADGHHCESRTVLGILGRDGALAEEFVMPERCLSLIPDDLPDERAVFAEPLAAAAHVLDVLPDGARRAVVVGDGKLGLLTAAVLASRGLTVTVVGHHEAKLLRARQMGADGVLEGNVTASLKGADACVDATGSASGLTLALSLARPRGVVVLKTTVSGPTTADLSPVVIQELTVVGSRCGSIPKALDLLRYLDVAPLISARYPLSEGEEAFAHASRRGVLKVLVQGPSA